MDRYQVKFEHQGRTFYAIWEKKAEMLPGHSIVADAVLPRSYIVEDSKLVDIPFPKNFGEGEYDKFVEAEFKKAEELSDSVMGLKVGKLFNTPVADGCAFYVITKVNFRAVKIEWRGFQGDRWIDQHFGHGGTFPSSMIETWVNRQDFWLEQKLKAKAVK